VTTIHLNQITTATPEQFVAGLTDFGPGREKLFGRSADGYLKVHDQSPGHADVTEGSGGIWERLQYDWSDPNHVVMKTIDSNTWGGASGHTYTLARQADGRRARRQEFQGTGVGGHAGDLRQARSRKATRKDGQGHRSPELRGRRGIVSVSRPATLPATTPDWLLPAAYAWISVVSPEEVKD